jgi:phosphatidylglycerophosphatase A
MTVSPATDPTNSDPAPVLSATGPAPTASTRKSRWAWTVATFFGAGLGKPGPGTWGSVAALLLWAAVAWGLHPAPLTLLLVLLAGIALTLIFGIPASTIVARESGLDDPSFVVVDEAAGQWIALIGCRADWHHALIALILFRLFDITKPYPVRQFERLPEGWGIVCDDVAAGLYELGVASLLYRWV